jgi:hypothetical protein
VRAAAYAAASTAKKASWPETNISSTNSATAAVSWTMATKATTANWRRRPPTRERERASRWATSTAPQPSGARILMVATAAAPP